MYINFVVKINHEVVPKSITYSSLYAIVTRRSLLGFHKQYSKQYSKQKNLDPLCTKTELVLFTNQNHANDFADILEKSHQNMVKFSRDISYDDYNVAKIESSLNFDSNDYKMADTIKPINIEVIPYKYMESLCLIHFFDMLLAYDMEIIQHDKNKHDIVFDCYQHRTFEFPNRALQEKLFRDLLYK